MSPFIKNLKTPIAIIGMARSGQAAHRLLLSQGIPSDSMFTFDLKLNEANFNDPVELMRQVQPKTLVVSPGVPLSSEWIQSAIRNGVKITSELSLACSCLASEKIIGVTGSLGKSTTVSILEAGLLKFCPSFFVGGNLGTPFAEYALQVQNKLRKRAEWVVLELSSYQLENCENLSLDYSAITYFTSNHLERYESIDHYYRTKWKILSLTKNELLLNAAGGDLVEFSKKNESEKIRIISKKDPRMINLHLEDALLIGQHNQDNLALAAAIALNAKWPASALDGMKQFKGLAHRMELVGILNGIRFINDSKATAIDSVLIATMAAYDTLHTGGKLFLLLGGRDKNLPWQDLHVLKNLKDVSFVFFGECRKIAEEKSQLPGTSYAKLKEAMDYLFPHIQSGDTVLLSPGGTSLDEFKSFEDRGNFFTSLVNSFAQRS